MTRGRDQIDPTGAFRTVAHSLARDRRRRLSAWLGLIAGLLLLGGVVPIWWSWPSADPLPLTLVAYDQIARPDEWITIGARLGPLDDVATMPGLAGRRAFFQDASTGLLETLAFTEDGLARIECRFPAKSTPAEVIVRSPGDGKRVRGQQALAKVYVWPADASLLLVDVDTALAEPAGDSGAPWRASNLDLRLQPGCPKALRAASEDRRIVYLSASADGAARYGKLKAWIERSWGPHEMLLPPGPLLGNNGQRSRMSAEAYLEGEVKNLQGRFSGQMLAVTGSPHRARVFEASGVKTYLMGTEDDSLPNGITLADSWIILEKELAR